MRKDREKKPSNNYKKIWKEKGFVFGYEERIYRFLCGARMFKKPKFDECFTERRKWEKYVREKFGKYGEEEIQNLIDYLSLRKRNYETGQKVNVGLVLPIFVVLIASDLIHDFSDWFFSLKVTVISWTFAVVLIGIFLFLFALYFLVNKAVGLIFDYEEKINFIEDFLIILEKIMKEK